MGHRKAEATAGNRGKRSENSIGDNQSFGVTSSTYPE